MLSKKEKEGVTNTTRDLVTYKVTDIGKDVGTVLKGSTVATGVVVDKSLPNKSGADPQEAPWRNSLLKCKSIITSEGLLVPWKETVSSITQRFITKTI